MAHESLDLELTRRRRGQRASIEDAAAYRRALERAGASELDLRRAAVEQEDHDGYLTLIRRRVPRPTPQQVADFACFAVSSHSWYKHLRFSPKSPMEFWLDPVPDSWHTGGFHYASHPVDFHVQEFGHWESRQPRPDATPPRVDAGDGATASVPPSLLAAGTAWVNPMLHPDFFPYHPRSAHEHLGIEAYAREMLANARPAGLSGLWQRLPWANRPTDQELWDAHAREQYAEQLAGLVHAMHTVLDLVYGPDASDERPLGRMPWHVDHTRPPPPPWPGQG